MQSLLVTYVSRNSLAGSIAGDGDINGNGNGNEEIKAIHKRIKAWEDGVGFLVDRVVDFGASKGVEVGLEGVGEVKEWVRNVGEGVRGHVEGRRRFKFPVGGWMGIVLEFRRLWEVVWKGFLGDEEKVRRMQEEMEVEGELARLEMDCE